MPTIEVYKRNVYGNEYIYPTGALASDVLELTKTKTLTRDNLRALQALGVTIKEVLDPTAERIGI